VSKLTVSDRVFSRLLSSAVVHVYSTGDKGAFSDVGPVARAYSDAISQDEFTLDLQFRRRQCQATLKPSTGTRLPIVVCALNLDAVQACADGRGDGLGGAMRTGFCLDQSACMP
jgi:hypothetical protein